MENGVGAGDQGDGLGGVGKAGSLNAEPVAAHGDVGEGEVAFGAGGGAELECRVEGLESDGSAGDGAVLGIVDDPRRVEKTVARAGTAAAMSAARARMGKARMNDLLAARGGGAARGADGQDGVTVRANCGRTLRRL